MCANDPGVMRRVDSGTVKAVEGTAPGSCRKDREKLYAKLHTGEIFGEFNEQERGVMWERLLYVSTDRLIPSFSTFFEDLNWLEGPLGCLSNLVHRFPGETMNSALSRMYTGVNQEPGYVKIQESDSSIAFVPGDDADRLDLGIRQGWMIAMRRWTDIPPKRKKKDCILRENLTYKESPKAVHEIATLLFELGFESEEIRDVLRVSPESIIAQNALLEARPLARFSYESSDFESYKSQMIRFFQTARELSIEDVIITAELDNVVESPTRLGKPSIMERKQTNPLLFADKLHCPENFEEVTPFFVRKSVYMAFFGTPEFNHVHISARRRSRPGNWLAYEESQDLIRERQLHDGERQLEEMRSELEESRQKLEDERRSLEGEKQKLGQDRENINQQVQEILATEKMRLIEKLNEELNMKWENEKKRLIEDFDIQIQNQLGAERGKIRAKLTEELGQKHNKEIMVLKEENSHLRDETQQLKQEKDQLQYEGQQRLEREKEIQREYQQRLEEDNRRLEVELLYHQGDNTDQEEAQQLEDEKAMLEQEAQQLREEKEKFQREADQSLKDKIGLEERLQHEAEQYLEELRKSEKRIQQLEDENTRLHQEARKQLEEQKARQQEAQELAKEEERHLKDRLQKGLEEKEKVQHELQKLLEVRIGLEERLQHLEDEKEKGLLEAQKQLESERARLQQVEQRLQEEITKSSERLQKVTQDSHQEKEQLGHEWQQVKQDRSQLENEKKNLNQQWEAEKSQLAKERRQVEQDRNQLEEEKSRLEQDREMLLKERNQLNESIQDVLRDKAAREQWQLKQLQPLLVQGTHFLHLPKATEGQNTGQALPPAAKARENNSTKRNPILGSESRANAMSLLQRLGRQADEAREKRRRIDGEGTATTVSRESAVKEQEQQEKGEDEREQRVKDAQELLAWWQASPKELASTKQSPRAKGIGALRRKRATQLRVQDAVASPSGTSEGSSPVSIMGVPVTFIVKENGEIREEMVPAMEVERKAWQYKKGGYNIYDKNGFTLSPASCYEDVTGDDSRTILVHPSSKLIDKKVVSSRKRQAQQIE